MNRVANIFSILLFGSLVTPFVGAYELATHGHITNEIFNRSALNPENDRQLEYLGIDNDADPFGIYYYDISSSEIYKRKTSSFEEDDGYMPAGAESLSVAGWLMRGAIREDDHMRYIFGPNPQDDPYSIFFSIPGLAAFAGDNRIVNHFFDPVNNTPLTLVPYATKAPDWALGTGDFIANPNTPNTSRRNHFTAFDARETMYRALTGRDTNGNTAIAPDGNGGYRIPQDGIEAAAVRNAYWATTFRALGDVLHLIEDMAQPQHTRNDQHLTNGAFDRKAYEAFTENRTTQKEFRCANSQNRLLPALVYGNYPIVDFDRYGDYFSSAAGNVLSGKGIADYSNRGFYSAGTNIGTTTYANPQETALTMQTVNLSNPCVPTTGAQVIEDLFLGSVPDTVSPAYIDTNSDGVPYTAGQVPLSARGVFHVEDNSDPGTYFINNAYTLTDRNYIPMADLLIPRAVAYGTGLVNYFFRGQITFVRDITNPNTWYIRNDSPETANGSFTLYYDAQDGLRYPVPGASWNFSIDTDMNSPAVTLTPPTNPLPVNPNEYMLVFRGDMGNEIDDQGAVGAVAGRRVCFPLSTGSTAKASFVIKCDGSIWGWGDNAWNQVAGVPAGIVTAPMELLSIGASFQSLTSGGGGNNHMLAIDASSILWGWGANTRGEVGNSNPSTTATPTQVLNDVIAADTGSLHSVALKTDNSVWTWGTNGSLQLGYNTAETVVVNGVTKSISSVPTVVPGIAGASAVAATSTSTLALINGTVWQWGRVETTTYDTPQPVPGLPTTIVAIAAGNGHSLALNSDGQVWAWGSNRYGQLGNSGGDTVSAILIAGLDIIKAVAAGFESSVALKADGTVWVWGGDRFGQLADGQEEPFNCFPLLMCGSSQPAQVAGMKPVISISAGDAHVLATEEDGTLWAWGGNDLGQIGDGTDASVLPVAQATPVRVVNMP